MDQHTGTEQEHQLRGMEQGQAMTLAITGAGGECVLEFKHASNPTWYKYPSFVGTPVDGVILQDVRCISGVMRVRFLAAPVAPYTLTTAMHVTPRI